MKIIKEIKSRTWHGVNGFNPREAPAVLVVVDDQRDIQSKFDDAFYVDEAAQIFEFLQSVFATRTRDELKKLL